jgi:hypothetical protein
VHFYFNLLWIAGSGQLREAEPPPAVMLLAEVANYEFFAAVSAL